MLNAATSARLAGFGLALLAGVALVPTPSRAIPLAGGTTTLELTGVGGLTDLGIEAETLGSASLEISDAGRVFVNFPVTGGNVDLGLLTGTIEHAGSGVSLGDGSVSVALTNFVIDLTLGALSGDVAVTGGALGGTSLSGVKLFDLNWCPIFAASDPCFDGSGAIRLDGYGARLSEAGAGALGAAFGLSDDTVLALQDGYLAIATLAVKPVPEPGTALLFVGGLAALGARRRLRA